MEKKLFSGYRVLPDIWSQTLRVMKCLTAFLLIFTLYSFTSSYSQKTKLKLDLKQASILDAIDEIESQSEFVFMYSDDILSELNKVQGDVQVENRTIERVLKKLIGKNNKLTYLVNDRQVVLKKNNTIKPTATKQPISTIVQFQVSGIVNDESGTPLPGASIVEKGTTNGTQSDFDGNFTIDVTDENATLVISYIGFADQEVSLNGQTNLTITLAESASGLDEVIVVGYGSTVKRGLTSSVASITTDEIKEIPATSLSNAVAGRFAGVNISLAGGKPGRNSEIIIRGATSGDFNGNNEPLYVIDNIIASKELFDALDVSEVENISILKDAASSSAYGSRAANGVVLVKTKSGKTGRPKINITSTIGSTKPTLIPPFTSGYQQALFVGQVQDWNNVDADDPARFNQTELDYLREQNFGSFLEQAEKTPLLTRQAISVSGGTEKVRYFMSGSFVKETGAFNNLAYRKTNLRAKVDADITNNLNVSLNLNTNNDLREEFFWRWNGNDEDFGDFYRTANRTGRWAPAVHNGEYVGNNHSGWNPLQLIDEAAGANDRKARNIGAIIDINYKIPFVKGLEAGVSYNTLNTRKDQSLVRRTTTEQVFAVDPNNRFKLLDEITGTNVRSDATSNTNSLLKSSEEINSYQLNARLKYKNTFGDHGVNLFVNYEQSEREGDFFLGRRRKLLSPLITQLFATDPASENQFATGNANESGRQSVIGSIGYDYKDKFFLNSTFRFDGSSNFAEDERWGFFPSISAAWILSEENFFKNSLSFIDLFKIRYSVGVTGNDDVTGSGATVFPYIQSYNGGLEGPVFGTGNALTGAVSIGGEPDPFITWEKQTSYNLGFDFNVLDNKLSTTLDFFKNKKTDLYGTRQSSIASSSGLSLGPVNYGAIDIKGVELLSTYKDNIGEDFSYEFGVVFGYSKATYVLIDETENARPYERQTGQITSRASGWISEGIIRTQQQLDGLIAQGYKINNQDPQLGALYFRDLRGNPTDDPEGNTPDGVVDGNDLSFLGKNDAPINYGLRLGFRYKRFNFMAFAQGFAGHKKYQPANNRFTFASIGQSSHTQWLDSWTPENPNASFPRFGSPNSGNNSTFWLEDADFLRLKNLNIGYDVPSGIAKKVGAERINIFANGTNLFMIYSKIKTFEPETTGRGIPVNKSYSLGLNITF